MTRKRGGYHNPPPSPRQRSTLPPFYEFYDQFTCPDYCYSTIWERLCIILSLVLITMSAFMLMASIIVYGELTTLYVDRSIGKAVLAPNHIIYLFGGSNTFNTNTSHERHLEELLTDSNAFGVASIVIMSLHFITASFGVFVINWTANRQITRIRYKFLENLLRQDISFYDTETNFSFATKMNDDLEKIKDGIGEKVVMFGYLVGSVLVCSTLSLCYGWELSLTGLTVIAVTIIVTALIARYQTKCSQEELSSYSGAGRCVEEVLGAIRTVVAFGGEAKEIDRYAAKLKPAEKCGRKRGMATALGSGINWLLTYSLNSIIFLYGTQLILNDSTKPIQEQTYQPGTLIIILCSIFIASQNITLCSPHMETFSAAKAAAITLYQLIERKSKIDALQKTGLKLDSIKGEICLNDVFFNYPSRPNTKVLNGLSVRIRAGESVGLVGESGCGKSTVLQLIQRLYDTDSGTIHIDGHDLRELNPNSLRSSIGVVGQEPVLFAGTVRDNIVIGQPDATDDDVIEAAKVAHAHGFITTLPEGYNTMITENGGSLSGGQKQRIAIARSIIRNPRILLLDEATSALDFKSEKIVQAALDKASKGRTTIAVTHRLSTIVNADRIIYIENGCVLEQGTHEELLALKGKYWQLVQADMQRNCHVTPEGDAQGPIEDLREKSPIRKSSIRESRNHKRHSLDMRRSSYSSINSGTYRVGPDINIPIDKSDIESYDGDESDTQANITMWDLLMLNKPELVWLVVGCIASIVVGASLPTFAVLLSRVFGMFSLTDREEIVSRSRLYSGLFLAVAGFCGIATFLQTHIFNMAGLKLTTRIRINLFTSYLRQEMSWFDQPTNSVGVLSARLSRDASSIQAASGVRLATILQSAATMFFGILIAMFFSWKMTLVSCLAVPVVIGAVYLEGVVSRVSRKREKKSMEDASRIASEAIMNIRTVQSMAIEDVILRKYQDALTATHSSHASGTRMRGLLYALGCCAPTVGYTLALYYGSQLIVKDKMPYQDCILVAEALIYGSWMLGQALSFTPNFSSAKMAAIRVLKLIDRKPTIISDDSSLKVNEQWEPDGDIKLESVDFSYRPDTKVLKDLTLNIEMNKTTAFVGHSGSGKSTIVQLLQRLYDVQAGNILIAGKSIKTDISLECLRSKLGIVQQEPILFDRTIEENIAYGDNTRTVQTDEIIEAAKRANIHSFIVSLPEGYATRLGSKGAQLSGGQKQRIAIARALVRNPKILLLDEATSALDTASEKIVQQALDEACKERTCIVIAHRLATIQNADHIYVLNKGELVEHGSHNELINKRGTYYDMFTSQAGS